MKSATVSKKGVLILTFALLISSSTSAPSPILVDLKKAIAPIPSSLTFIKHQAFKPNHYFCRINGICRIGDGTIVLPKWMKEHSEHIANCGVQNISFTLDDHFNHQENKKKKKNNKGETLKLRDELRGTDLLGGEAVSADRHVLATQLTPYLHALDMLQRPSAYATELIAVCVKAGGAPCMENKTRPSLSSNLHPLLLVDSRISNTKDFQWPKSLLRLLRTSMDGRFQYIDQQEIYGWTVRTRASCFRSLISTNVRTGDMATMTTTLHPQNAFFAKNNLLRTSAKKPASAFAHCAVKVLILNRYGRRFIEGGSALASAINAYGRQVKRQAGHVDIEPEVLFFENLSFHEQVSVVQEADVIIATHGENNANFMFLRPHTRVIELLPFGYTSHLYANLSVAYNAEYTVMTSQPDAQVFKACIRHFNPQTSDTRDGFLQKWQVQADKFIQDTIKWRQNMASDYAVPLSVQGRRNQTSIKQVRECAGYQRISVDVKHLARTAVLAAAKQCPLRAAINLSPS